MNVLVTGGGGFLGGEIVRLLTARGDSVRSFTRTAYPWLTDLGVEQILGNLADADAVRRAVTGCEAVIHTAAKAGVWGRFADFHTTNVVGTRNILAACQKTGVGRLVFTSTPSVVHAGHGFAGVTESTPIPPRHEAAYPATKAEAEKLVRAANGPNLATVALRPHLIWGPGDPHLVPRVLARARVGRLRRIGTNPVMVDVTYITNAATAHLNALDRLTPDAACAGQAYFITNGEPIELWEFLNRVLALAGLPPVQRTLPLRRAQFAATVLERLYRTFKLSGEPPLTRFVVSQLSTSHWFDITAAKRDLGYTPTVTLEQGLERLAAELGPRCDTMRA